MNTFTCVRGHIFYSEASASFCSCGALGNLVGTLSYGTDPPIPIMLYDPTKSLRITFSLAEPSVLFSHVDPPTTEPTREDRDVRHARSIVSPPDGPHPLADLAATNGDQCRCVNQNHPGGRCTNKAPHHSLCGPCQSEGAVVASDGEGRGTLLSCPFCGGGRNVVERNSVTFWVECDDCDATGPQCISERSAIDAWNRRANAPSEQTAQTNEGRRCPPGEEEQVAFLAWDDRQTAFRVSYRHREAFGAGWHARGAEVATLREKVARLESLNDLANRDFLEIAARSDPENWPSQTSRLDEIHKIAIAQRIVTNSPDHEAADLREQIANRDLRIEILRKELVLADSIIAARNKVLDALPCNVHGRCVPHALDQIEAMRRSGEAWGREVASRDEEIYALRHAMTLAECAADREREKDHAQEIAALRSEIAERDERIESFRNAAAEHAECVMEAHALGAGNNRFLRERVRMLQREARDHAECIGELESAAVRRATEWCNLATAMLAELRQDYGPMELPNEAGVDAIKRLRAQIAAQPDVSAFWIAQAEWSNATFGDATVRGPLGPLLHAQKEIGEAIEAMGTNTFTEEIGDVVSILLDAARRGGLTLDDLVAQMFRKLAVNKTRAWSAPNANEPVEHVREPR